MTFHLHTSPGLHPYSAGRSNEKHQRFDQSEEEMKAIQSSEEPRGESTFKPAFTLMSGRIAAFAITFLTPILLVRVFDQHEFGTYKQFLLVTYTVFLFAQCGFAESLFYFLPKNRERGGSYAFNSLLVLFACGAVCMVGLIWNTDHIVRWMNNPELAKYIPLMGTYILFILMGTVLEITMISRKEYKLAAATYVASDLLRAGFLVIPALITHSLKWALIGSLVFFILRVGAALGYFRYEFRGTLRFDRHVLKEQWAYALPLSLAGAVQVIQQNYHQYVVAYHFDPVTFAIYSVGCLQIPLVDFMSTPASNVMMVRMTEELRHGNFRRLIEIWYDTTRKLALLFFPLVGLLVVNAYNLITLLFTKKFEASVPIFMVWSLSILLAALQTDGVMRVFAEMKCLLYINLTRLLLLFLTIGWFLSRFNLMGAVLITLIGMVLAKTLAMLRIRQVLKTSYRDLLPWTHLGWSLVAAAIACIPAAFVNAHFDIPVLVLLPISGMLYTLSYATLVLVLRLLTNDELAAIKRILFLWNRRSAIEPEPLS
jgi:O-antigen/teichoic acid export membrane protein